MCKTNQFEVDLWDWDRQIAGAWRDHSFVGVLVEGMGLGVHREDKLRFDRADLDIHSDVDKLLKKE